uniref:Secreted protein n=1 Tax=Ascaris lumbricoides TaxID=6252 RepID=A0A0M3IGI8_ASCLU
MRSSWKPVESRSVAVIVGLVSISPIAAFSDTVLREGRVTRLIQQLLLSFKRHICARHDDASATILPAVNLRKLFTNEKESLRDDAIGDYGNIALCPSKRAVRMKRIFLLQK